MISGSISRRYARALFDLAKDAGQVPAVLKELEQFVAQLKQVPALREVMERPSVSQSDRVAVLEGLCKASQYSPLVRRFLLFLAGRHRVDVADGILREYRGLCDELEGVVRVTVTTAVPLPAEHEKALVTELETLLKARVVLTRQVDPTLMGGIVTRVGDLLIDSSLVTRLNRLKSALLQEQSA